MPGGESRRGKSQPEQRGKKREEKNTVKTFSPFFPQDISADIAKLCDEEIQTVEGEEVTYL